MMPSPRLIYPSRLASHISGEGKIVNLPLTYSVFSIVVKVNKSSLCLCMHLQNTYKNRFLLYNQMSTIYTILCTHESKHGDS